MDPGEKSLSKPGLFTVQIDIVNNLPSSFFRFDLPNAKSIVVCSDFLIFFTGGPQLPVPDILVLLKRFILNYNNYC